MAPTDREMGAITVRVDQLEATMADINEKLTEVRDAMLRAEGSWRALMAIAGLSAALGAGLAKVIDWAGILVPHHP